MQVGPVKRLPKLPRDGVVLHPEEWQADVRVSGTSSTAVRAVPNVVREIATLAVVDVTRRCAFTLAVSQTPPGANAQAEPEETRVDFYKQQLRTHRHRLPPGCHLSLRGWLLWALVPFRVIRSSFYIYAVF